MLKIRFQLLVIGRPQYTIQMQANRDFNHSIVAVLTKEFTKFLQSFHDRSGQYGEKSKYMVLIHQMLDCEKHILVIDHKDLISFNSDLANMIFDEFFKYEQALNASLTHLVRECEKNIMSAQEQTRREDEKQEKYQVTFDSSINSSDEASVRDLRCDKLGKLICFRGTITRTTEVRPELISGVFKCKNCGTMSKSTPQQFKYSEPKKCYGNNCEKSDWELNVSASHFADFQKLRVQEDPTKIPPGAMPRSVDIIVRNQMAQRAQPGDRCKFIGYLCVLPEIASMLKPGQRTTISSRNIDTRGNFMEMQGVIGLKGIRQLNYKLIFTATNIIVENNQFRQQQDYAEQTHQQLQDPQSQKQIFNQELIISKVFNKLSQKQIFLIKQFKQNSNLYEDMANSLFPSIFGHIEIKKALLLQLFGGIHKITQNKICIRGDINILIVGDPSTAKSQFLKVINKFVPRSVYTNGKTTTAAGLTASVTRDQNGNVGIEAGALMLADNGICCIDQFDKMDINDQTAIHEAMQQQTISIAKAGVYATLNARTSVLAAANPIFGRYDKSKSLKHNLNISAPIMSRFDLFFIVYDEANEHSDAHLSQFLIDMHRNKESALARKYDKKSLTLYISTAKKLKPMITLKAAELLRVYYNQLRLKDKNAEATSYRVTVRQLESMIRISEALARLNLDTQVKCQYVKEAYNLISSSIIKLEKSPITLFEEQPEQTNKQKAHKTTLAMKKELENKKEEKKNKQISISHELYQEIQKNVVELFKKQQQIEQADSSQITIKQQQLVVYLLGVNFESGMVSTEEESFQMKKIIVAVIKKLIKEERALMVVEDHEDISQRVLRIHPNYEA